MEEKFSPYQKNIKLRNYYFLTLIFVNKRNIIIYCTVLFIADVVKENTLKDLAGYVFAEPVQQSNAAVSVVKNNETKFTTSTESSDDKIKDISHVQRRICRKIAEVPAIYSEVKETTESNIDETDDQKKEIKHNILSSIRGYKETKYLLERNSCRGRRLTCDLDNCHLPLKTSSAKGDSDNDDNDETQDDLKKNMKISRTKASKNKQPEFIKKEHVYCDIIEDELDKESKKGRKRFQIPEFSAYQKQNLADKSGGSKSSSQIRQTKDIDPEDLPSEYPANDELHTSSEDGAYETVTPTAPGHVLKGMTLYSDVLLKGNPEGERKLPKTRTFREIKSPSRVVPVQRPKSHLIKPALL